MAKKVKQDWRRPEARVNLYLQHEVLRILDRRVARQQKAGYDTNRSKWIAHLVAKYEGDYQL